MYLARRLGGTKWNPTNTMKKNAKTFNYKNISIIQVKFTLQLFLSVEIFFKIFVICCTIPFDCDRTVARIGFDG